MSSKRPSVPLNLYKYTSAEVAHRILITKKVRFTQPNLLNDPFEAAPHFDKLLTPASIIEHAIRKPEVFSRELQRVLSQEIERLCSGVDSISSETAMKVVHAVMQTEGFSKLLASGLHGLTTLLDQSMNSGWQYGISKSVGILCLSPNPLCELMWAHYADMHKGAVVVFDARHDFFHSVDSVAHELHQVKAVSYTDERPVLSDLLSSEMAGMTNEELLQVLFFTKSSSWAYEDEYRMLRNLIDIDPVSSDGGEQIYLIDVPDEAIQGVIVGANCHQADIERLKSALTNINPNWKPMAVKPSRDKYDLGLRNLP